jgi:hypothetical protein
MCAWRMCAGWWCCTRRAGPSGCSAVALHSGARAPAPWKQNLPAGDAPLPAVGLHRGGCPATAAASIGSSSFGSVVSGQVVSGRYFQFSVTAVSPTSWPKRADVDRAQLVGWDGCRLSATKLKNPSFFPQSSSPASGLKPGWPPLSQSASPLPVDGPESPKGSWVLPTWFYLFIHPYSFINIFQPP